ncbi:unnamed protein product, partial [Bubo scandiacus]
MERAALGRLRRLLPGPPQAPRRRAGGGGGAARARRDLYEVLGGAGHGHGGADQDGLLRAVLPLPPRPQRRQRRRRRPLRRHQRGLPGAGQRRAPPPVRPRPPRRPASPRPPTRRRRPAAAPGPPCRPLRAWPRPAALRLRRLLPGALRGAAGAGAAAADAAGAAAPAAGGGGSPRVLPDPLQPHDWALLTPRLRAPPRPQV